MMPLPLGLLSSSSSQKEGQGEAKGWAEPWVSAAQTALDSAPQIHRATNQEISGHWEATTLRLSLPLSSPPPWSRSYLSQDQETWGGLTGRQWARVPRPHVFTLSEFVEVTAKLSLQARARPGCAGPSLPHPCPEPSQCPGMQTLAGTPW